MVRRRKCMLDDPDQDIGDQEGHADNIECAMSRIQATPIKVRLLLLSV